VSVGIHIGIIQKNSAFFNALFFIRHIFGANQDIYKPDFVPDKSGGNHFSWHNIAVMLMRLPLFRHVNETNTVLRPARI